MENISSYQTLRGKIDGQPILLVFISAPDACACRADLPRTADLCDALTFPAVHVDAAAAPEASGQLGVFTAPAVLLFKDGREYHRQARFIDFSELEKRMRELLIHEASPAS